MKLLAILLRARKWFFSTPERALERAYQAALKIQSLEERHFAGEPVSQAAGAYSESAIAYFQGEVNQHLTTAKVRLAEFKTSNYILFSYYFIVDRLELQGEEENKKEQQVALAIEKLSFIDNIAIKYRKQEESNTASILASLESENKINKKDKKALKEVKGDKGNPETYLPIQTEQVKPVVDQTSFIPRSILSTFSRLKEEMNREEEQIVQKFRTSRKKTNISIRFLLILIIVPLLAHQLSKTILVTPVVEKYLFTEESQKFFLNQDIEEETLMELEKFEKTIKLEIFMGLRPKYEQEEMDEKLKEKAEEIVQEARSLSHNAVANIFADIFSLMAFAGVIWFRKKDIVVLKSFMDDIIYGLSDSAKAFLIILFTDIFVGYHSPHGWEIILEGISRHWGIAESREWIFIFIATFPVILDTVLKYWIFRYLNRISPSAVATYRSMNE